MNRISKLQDMLKSSPDDAFLQHALALEYVKIGDDKSAAEVFERLLTLHEDYIGAYYHLAKLYERAAADEKAAATYKAGMQQAQKAGDNHAYSELKSAYEFLIF